MELCCLFLFAKGTLFPCGIPCSPGEDRTINLSIVDDRLASIVHLGFVVNGFTRHRDERDLTNCVCVCVYVFVRVCVITEDLN